MSDIFDFGFTAVDESELEAVQQAQAATENASETEEKLNALYNAILPLLSNLKANPERDYLYWPGKIRSQKVDEFEEKIKKIVYGD